MSVPLIAQQASYSTHIVKHIPNNNSNFTHLVLKTQKSTFGFLSIPKLSKRARFKPAGRITTQAKKKQTLHEDDDTDIGSANIKAILYASRFIETRTAMQMSKKSEDVISGIEEVRIKSRELMQSEASASDTVTTDKEVVRAEKRRLALKAQLQIRARKATSEANRVMRAWNAKQTTVKTKNFNGDKARKEKRYSVRVMDKTPVFGNPRPSSGLKSPRAQTMDLNSNTNFDDKSELCFSNRRKQRAVEVQELPKVAQNMYRLE